MLSGGKTSSSPVLEKEELIDQYVKGSRRVGLNSGTEKKKHMTTSLELSCKKGRGSTHKRQTSGKH